MKAPLLILLSFLLTSVSILEGQAAINLSLTLSPTAVNFPSSDPDTVPSIPASENPISVRVRVTGNPGGNWRLTVLVAGDLLSGSRTIPISNVSWTAEPLPFIDGRLDKSTPQLVASGTGNVNLTGTMRFFFKNSWNYPVGNYSQAVIFTLSAP